MPYRQPFSSYRGSKVNFFDKNNIYFLNFFFAYFFIFSPKKRKNNFWGCHAHFWGATPTFFKKKLFCLFFNFYPQNTKKHFFGMPRPTISLILFSIGTLRLADFINPLHYYRIPCLGSVLAMEVSSLQ